MLLNGICFIKWCKWLKINEYSDFLKKEKKPQVNGLVTLKNSGISLIDQT